MTAAAVPFALAQSSGDAAQSAEAWVRLIDSGKFEDSWTEASTFFRSQVPRDRWTGMVKGVRAPLGLVKSRTVKNVTTAKSLPGAPDGDYTVIQYQTSFQNKATAVETLTVMMDGGRWRAAGYFIK